MASGKGFYGDECGPGYRHDDELRNAVTDRDRIRHGGVGVQKGHADLSAVAGVDRTRTVDDGDAVFGSETAAGNNKGDVAVGKRYRDSGTNGCPCTGSQLEGLGGHEVGSRVTRVRVGRHLLSANEYFYGISHVTRVVQNGCASEKPRASQKRRDSHAQRKMIE